MPRLFRSIALLAILALIGCNTPTEPAVVFSIDVSASKSILASRESVQLVALLRDKKGNPIEGLVIWVSVDTSIATVSPTGLVTAGANPNGTPTSVIIEGRAGVARDTFALSVLPLPVGRINISAITSQYRSTDTVRLVASVYDATGVSLSGRSIEWSSADTTIARISTSGIVTSPFFADTIIRTVRLTAVSEGQNATLDLNVRPWPVAHLRLTSDSVSLYPGDRRVVLWSVVDSANRTLSQRKISWVTSDSTKATVSTKDTVTAAAYWGGLRRSVQIIAVVEGKPDSLLVVIHPHEVHSIAFLEDSVSIAKDFARTLRFEIKDSIGRNLDTADRQFVWTSADSLLAKVQQIGHVRGVREGRTSIQVSAGGRSDSVGVSVIQPKQVKHSVWLGDVTTCGLSSTLRIYCWGLNANERRLGSAAYGGFRSSLPIETTGTYGVQSLGHGRSSCAIATQAIQVLCWGLSLGISVQEPTPIPSTSSIVSLTSTADNFCGITAAGSTVCWGTGFTRRYGLIPTEQDFSERFVDIVSGSGDSYDYSWCGLSYSGQAFCWGSGAHGRRGTGLPLPAFSLELSSSVGNGMVFQSISSRGSHTCGIDGWNRLFCWGDGSAGALGIGSSADAVSPKKVLGSIEFATVSAGYNHTCGLDVGGRAWCWGLNTYGQLGVGSTVSSTAPTPVFTDRRFVRIFAGEHSSCALESSGDLYCWGRNLDGELGVGSLISSTTPLKVLAAQPFQIP